MTLSPRLVPSLAALILLAAIADATPIVWTLEGVLLSDGGTASGTFTFDPDAGIPCARSSPFGPCGQYSDVHIVTTDGQSRTGATYSFVCEEDVVSCTGVNPDSAAVLFLTSNAMNQTGDPGSAFFFTNGYPPQGLTDAGGVVDISGRSEDVGSVNEATCFDASCSAPSGPSRGSIAGNVSASPEPTTSLLLMAGFVAMASLNLRLGRLII